MYRWLLPALALTIVSLGCSERAGESSGPVARADEAPASSETEVGRTFVVRLLSPADAAALQPGVDERRRTLQTSPGFANVVLSRPGVPDDEIALVEVTVWGSPADAQREAEAMSGTVGVYSVLMQIGESGSPVFDRPHDVVLFDSPNVTEPFFRAEVEVFARLSDQSPGFGGFLLKNIDDGGTIPFIYLAQWGSEEARERIRQSDGYAAAREVARIQKTDVMKIVELQRVD